MKSEDFHRKGIVTSLTSPQTEITSVANVSSIVHDINVTKGLHEIEL